MNSSPTTNGPTSPNQSIPPFMAQPVGLTHFDDFEFEWPGRDRWAVMVDRVREHIFAMEEWWTVRRSGSGDLGISPPPRLLPMDDDAQTRARPSQTTKRHDGVGFAAGWTLLTS